jgi:hypothetical protein
MPTFPSQGDYPQGSIFGRSLVLRIEETYKALSQLRNRKPNETTISHFHERLRGSEQIASRTEEIFSRDFLAFVKVFNSELPMDHPENYYTEREWRKFQNLVFEPSDVCTIVVAANFQERLGEKFPEYKSSIKSVEL